MLRGKSCSEVCATISADPSRFNRLFRKLLLRDCADPYFLICQSFEAKSKKLDPYGGSVGGHTCHMCLNVFADPKSCKAHLAKVHNIRTPAMMYVRSTSCWGCGLQFLTFPRILQHLSRNRSRGVPNRCLAAIVALNLTFSKVEFDECLARHLDESIAMRKIGRRPHFAAIAAVRIIGPTLL